MLSKLKSANKVIQGDVVVYNAFKIHKVKLWLFSLSELIGKPTSYISADKPMMTLC